MLESADFVPVSSLYTPGERVYITPEKRVYFAGNFPEWLDLDKIALNLKRTQTICNFGGISTVVIYGTNDEETYKSIPQIAGFNSSGEAYASKVSTATQVLLFDTISTPTNPEAEHPYRQILAGIILNNNEVVQRIQNDRGSKRNVRSTDTWAHYIDKSLGRGLENIGVKYLVTGLNRNEILFAVFTYILPIPILAGLHGFLKLAGVSYSPEFTGYLFGYAGMLLPQSIERIRHQGRLSLFFGPQFDRAAALVALTRTGKLVKPLF